jgi:ribosomal protein S18 acetylase RimI-like enzyme
MILKAVLADAPALNQLVNSAYRGDTSRQGWTTEADLLDGTRIDEAAMRDLIEKPGTVILTYREAGELLGCVELRFQEGKLYLGMLSVKPDTQGTGIGKKLMQAAEDYATQQNINAIIMTVISVRKELIDWYIRHGYQLTGERKPFIVPDTRWGVPKKATGVCSVGEEVMNKLKVIAFDADDTLWHNEAFFQETEKKFFVLLENYLPQHTTARELLKTEIDNLPLYGYGIKAFMLSMIETAMRDNQQHHSQRSY